MTSHVIVVNSIDREWGYGSTFNYTFNFNNGGISGNLISSIKNIKGFYIESIIMPNIFIDIFSVHGCKKLGLLPSLNGDINTNNLSFSRISDLRYIVVEIRELRGNISGSHNINNKASAVFMFDTLIPKLSHSNLQTTSYQDSSEIKYYTNSHLKNRGEGIMSDTNHDYIVLKNISREPTMYIKDMLSSINIKFFSPNGKNLTLMNDILSIKSIGSTRVQASGMSNVGTKTFTTNVVLREGLYVDRTDGLLVDDNTYVINKSSNTYTLNRDLSNTIVTDTYFESRKIEITSSEYFSSEEYKIGDTLVFKKLASKTESLSIIPDNELITFLERGGGHTIVGLRKGSGTGTLYNIIEILPLISIDLLSGVETTNFFGLEGTTFYNMSGTIINRDNQNVVSINIKN
jgi:hypothetical protein